MVEEVKKKEETKTPGFKRVCTFIPEDWSKQIKDWNKKNICSKINLSLIMRNAVQKEIERIKKEDDEK